MMRRILSFAVGIFPLLLLAELPPSAYEAMQAKATEFLEIQVLRVEIEPGDSPERQKVSVSALVNKVNRTGHSLKPGDIITISYTITDRQKGWAGPREIPLLEEMAESVAYLSASPDESVYLPMAGAMSFRNF